MAAELAAQLSSPRGDLEAEFWIRSVGSRSDFGDNGGIYDGLIEEAAGHRGMFWQKGRTSRMGRLFNVEIGIL